MPICQRMGEQPELAHLEGTAEILKLFAAKFGKEALGRFMALLHDIGKFAMHDFFTVVAAPIHVGRAPGFWILGFTLFCYDVSATGTGFVFPFLTGFRPDAAKSPPPSCLWAASVPIRFCLVGGVLSDKLFHP